MLEELEFENARADYESRLADAGADDEYSPEYSPETLY